MLFDKPFLPFFPWTTKLGLLLAAIQDLAFVHHQRMLFRSFWIVFLPFPFPFPVLLFIWRPLNGLDRQTHSVSSRVQKHDFSSSTWPCSPVTSSLGHCPNSSSALSSTINVLFMPLTCPLTRSDGVSIELFGVTKNYTNTVLSVSKVLAGIAILRRERERVSLSLSELHSDHLQQ